MMTLTRSVEHHQIQIKPDLRSYTLVVIPKNLKNILSLFVLACTVAPMTTSDNTGNQAANSLTQKNPRTSNIIIMRLQRHEQRRITHAAVYSLTRHNQGKDWVGLSHDYRKRDSGVKSDK